MGKRCSVLIAGCGDLGCRLGMRLSAAGWRVYGLRRQAADLPVPILPIKGDLNSEACPRAWPNGELDYLVYAASANQHDEAQKRRDGRPELEAETPLAPHLSRRRTHDGDAGTARR